MKKIYTSESFVKFFFFCNKRLIIIIRALIITSTVFMRFRLVVTLTLLRPIVSDTCERQRIVISLNSFGVLAPRNPDR